MKNWKTLEPDKVKLLNKHYTKGRGGNKIEFIVIHHNAGVLTTEQCWDVWQTRPASAHYQVERDGTIGQLVWDKDTAWHAANATANRKSIAIEHANASSTTSPVTGITLEEGAHLTAALCVYYKLGRPVWGKNVKPHRTFTSTSCPGHLAGSQNAQYMRRAQYWYDEMTGVKAAGTAAPKPVNTKPPISYSATMGKSSFNRKIIQEALAKQNMGNGASYYNGPIDGVFGPMFYAGLRLWRIAVYKTLDEDIVGGKMGRDSFDRLASWMGYNPVD